MCIFNLCVYNCPQVIKYEKLDLPHSSCEQSPDYNFASCVERSIMNIAVCQPPWRRFSVDNLPICNNMKMLDRYGRVYDRMMNKFKDDIIETTKCKLPCSYLEFKVGIKMKE